MEILNFRQKTLTTLYNRTSGYAPSIQGLYNRRNMEGQKNSLKPYLYRLFIKEQPKTILRPISSFTVKEDHIGSAVCEILRYRQKNLLLYILGGQARYFRRIKFYRSRQNLDEQLGLNKYIFLMTYILVMYFNELIEDFKNQPPPHFLLGIVSKIKICLEEGEFFLWTIFL